MQNNKLFVGTPNDLFPIILHEGYHVIDSRLIAEALGINHGNFMETIKKYQNDVTNHFGKLPFETEAIGKTKQKQRYALLNETQATFLATLSRNTPQVIAFKTKLVLSFAELRKDFSKIYTLWYELMKNIEKDDYLLIIDGNAITKEKSLNFKKRDFVYNLIFKNNNLNSSNHEIQFVDLTLILECKIKDLVIDEVNYNNSKIS